MLMTVKRHRSILDPVVGELSYERRRADAAEREVAKLSALNEALRDLLVSMRPAVAIEGDIVPPKTVQQADADFVAMTKENKKR